MVASPSARGVQDSDARPPVLVRSCPGIPADDCQLVTDARASLLRSADTRTLTLHRTSSCFGTGPLQLRPQECWTVCRQTYERQSCHTPGSGGCWRYFYFDSPTTAHCNFSFFKLRRIEIFVLTSLQFTYLHTAGRRTVSIQKSTLRTAVCSQRRVQRNLLWPLA